MSARRRIWLYVAILAVAVAAYYPFSPGGSQSTNMRRADRHIETLLPQISADSRFANVQFSSYTGQGGSLLVRGTVATDEDASALLSIIRQSEPPVEIAFRVSIESSATQPSAAP